MVGFLHLLILRLDEANQAAREALLDRRDRLVSITGHLRVVEIMSGEEWDSWRHESELTVN